MTTPERRRIPRTTPERLSYIHIEPNNGGIVLNVSGEGLCFHSTAPVERNGPFRFALLEHNRRIDACGELIWTDEIQKVGGLRFTTLTSEARGQINDWVTQPLVPVEDDRACTRHGAFLKAFRGLGTWQFDSKADSSEKADSDDSTGLPEALPKFGVRIKLSGFSVGLATGLLVSALGTSALFFTYAHRHEFGELLIRLGGRLAASSEVQRSDVVPAPQVVAATGVSPTQATVSTPRAAEPHEELLVPPLASVVKARRVTLNPPAPVTAVPQVGGPVSQRSPATEPGDLASVPPAVSLGEPSLSSLANLIPDNLDRAHEIELASAGHTPGFSAGTPSSLQMYFDVGRFKDGLLAHDVSDRVAQLGLRTTVVQKGHLWINSYQVLVGPYSDEEEETRIQDDLLAHGYKPRPFERGARDFMFSSPVSVNGSDLPVGDFTISWESYVADAKVKFAQRHDVIVKADGRWMKRPQKYSRNEYVYVKNRNGSRTLLEIHFEGLNRTLVFRNSS